MSNPTAPTFIEWLTTTPPLARTHNYTISISNNVVFASRRTLTLLYYAYSIWLLEKNFTIPEFPSYLESSVAHDEAMVSPGAEPSRSREVSPMSSGEVSPMSGLVSLLSRVRTSIGGSQESLALISPTFQPSSYSSSSRISSTTSSLLAFHTASIIIRAETMLHMITTSPLFVPLLSNPLMTDSLIPGLISRIEGLRGARADMEEIRGLSWELDDFERTPVSSVARSLCELAVEMNGIIPI